MCLAKTVCTGCRECHHGDQLRQLCLWVNKSASNDSEGVTAIKPRAGCALRFDSSTASFLEIGCRDLTSAGVGGTPTQSDRIRAITCAGRLDGLCAHTGGQWGDGAVVKAVASGRSSRWISEQRGLVLDANGAISGSENFRSEVGGLGCDSLGGSDDVGGGCTHCVSP